MNQEYIKDISKRIINKESGCDRLSMAQSGYYSYQLQLRLIRKAMGYTQKRVAEKAGISVRSLTRIEKGEVDAPILTLLKIARVLDSEIVVLVLPRKPIEEIVDEKVEKEARKIVKMNTGNAAMEGQVPNDEVVQESIRQTKAMLYKKRNISWDD
jgi:transcriptional regulator with XRE-family HTH domain